MYRRPRAFRASTRATTIRLFHKKPDRRKARARAADGFSEKLRTRAHSGASGTGSPGSIQPYSSSGPSGSIPRMTTASGHRPTTRHVRQEDALLQDEVVRGKDRHDGLRIAPAHPVHGPEDSGPGSLVGRLEKGLWNGPGKIATEVPRMGAVADDDCALRRDQRGDPGQCLAEERPASGHFAKLLWALVAGDVSGQPAEATAFPARENNPPRVGNCRLHLKFLLGQGAQGPPRGWWRKSTISLSFSFPL